MLKIFSYLHTVSLYPAARLIVWWKSEQQRLRTLGKRAVVHFENGYDSQKIMLLALYEKGDLRPDVVRLLEAAQAEGLYVVAVNTLKLKDPESLKGLVDCYIERPNFGRDFGSYKTGFLHVFDRSWHETCPRLLMVNDSIFFSAHRVQQFLRDMITSDVEVLGGTENYEIEHHMGSFCIAMANNVLCAPRFIQYWKKYILSDVRPSVIKRGEMELSKTLKRVISRQGQFRALYNTSRVLREVSREESLLNFIIKNARTSSLSHWERFNAQEVIKELQQRFIMQVNRVDDEKSKMELRSDAPLEELHRSIFVQDIDSMRKFLLEHVENAEDVSDEIIQDTIISVSTRVFMIGSQIHQNGTILLHMGCPLVKLDGMYRGMFNVYDIQRICAQLNPQEAEELKEILLERPFGGDTYIGWRKAAFMVGLI